MAFTNVINIKTIKIHKNIFKCIFDVIISFTLVSKATMLILNKLILFILFDIYDFMISFHLIPKFLTSKLFLVEARCHLENWNITKGVFNYKILQLICMSKCSPMFRQIHYMDCKIIMFQI